MRQHESPDGRDQPAWLDAVLARNAPAAYLRHFGSPTNLQAFRESIPATTHDALAPWLDRVAGGEPDVLFLGRPCAYECTGGSSGGSKLIPYTTEGLEAFEAALAPWLADVVSRYGVSGSVYLATSPATRPALQIGDTPLGLPDGAYLGTRWGEWAARHSAVPLDVARETSVEVWRERTLTSLSAAHDLEMVSVWSPTFLLQLLDDLPDAREMWPRLKLVSCWTSGASRRTAAELGAKLPHVHLQPKGLMSTECVVTVPDTRDRPALNAHGFFEFERDGHILLAEDLEQGAQYEVIATTASGLYRYRTGDLVLCKGFADTATPVLEFQGRAGIVSDLVGEKLVEAFAQDVLDVVPGWAFLTVQPGGAGYAVVTEASMPVDLAAIDVRLKRNPQYAYAVLLNQLKPLLHRPVERLYDRFVEFRLAQGARLADIKLLALIPEAGWIE